MDSQYNLHTQAYANHPSSLDNQSHVSIPNDLYHLLLKSAFPSSTPLYLQNGSHNSFSVNTPSPTCQLDKSYNNLNSLLNTYMPNNREMLENSTLKGGLKESVDTVRNGLARHFEIINSIHANVHCDHDETNNIQEFCQVSSRKHTTLVSGQKPQNTNMNSNTITGMLDELKNKMDNVDNTINKIESQLDSDLSDPNKREWEFSSFIAGSSTETSAIFEHARALYTNLYNQAKANEDMITALRNKLAVLQTHAKPVPADYRNAL